MHVFEILHVLLQYSFTLPCSTSATPSRTLRYYCDTLFPQCFYLPSMTTKFFRNYQRILVLLHKLTVETNSPYDTSWSSHSSFRHLSNLHYIHRTSAEIKKIIWSNKHLTICRKLFYLNPTLSEENLFLLCLVRHEHSLRGCGSLRFLPDTDLFLFEKHKIPAAFKHITQPVFLNFYFMKSI